MIPLFTMCCKHKYYCKQNYLILYIECSSSRLRGLLIENKKPEFILKMSKGEIQKGIYRHVTKYLCR